MGYQESYITTKDDKDFDKLVELFKKVGKRYYDDNDAGPVRIITINKPISGNLEWMCSKDKTYSFEAGKKFVYVVGERYLQRSIPDLFDGNRESDNYDISIFFTECFPSEEIFGENTPPIATHEKFIW